MQRRAVIGSIGAILGTSVGTAAYTSATVNRDATFRVGTDANGLIGLGVSGQSEHITKSSENLTIDVPKMNSNGTFVYGNDASPPDLSTEYAFSFTNNDSASRDITVSFAYTDASALDSSEVTFEIYEDAVTDGSTAWSTTNSIDSVKNGNDAALTGVASGKEHRVVLTIDTSGLDSTNDLSGTLSFNAN